MQAGTAFWRRACFFMQSMLNEHSFFAMPVEGME
jgi:hypothetical protein